VINQCTYSIAVINQGRRRDMGANEEGGVGVVR
jgi:hypothetical protein